MCYRTKLNSKIRSIEETFEATFNDPETYHPMKEINGFDFPLTPIITDEDRETFCFSNGG